MMIVQIGFLGCDHVHEYWHYRGAYFCHLHGWMF